MNNTVLITGGSNGIGRELAKLFAKDGYDLVIVSRNQQNLESTAIMLRADYGIKVTTISKDLFNPHSSAELYESLISKNIHIDVLVNNAGHGAYGLFAENDLKKQQDIIQLNITSLVTLTHLFLKDMLEAGHGKILNLSSIASQVPGPWQAVYHATKSFVQSFTEAIRSEVKDKGIVVTALLPGITDTDFFNKADMNSSKAVQDEDSKADPAGVAKDGYEALMAGKDKVISGLKNKLQMGISNITPDSMIAHNMNEMQKPVDAK